eukprot:bmy_05846T0
MNHYEAELFLKRNLKAHFCSGTLRRVLFSVIFRRDNRSLPARIEQWNHNLNNSFLHCNRTFVERFKDLSSCMFFGPLLTISLNRTLSFRPQYNCHAVICRCTTYDGGGLPSHQCYRIF